MHPNIAFLCRTVYQGFFALFIDLLRFYALCIFSESSYKHLLVRRRNARSSGDEETNPKHQNLYVVAGALCFFLHQRNEWHNEATSLNVRAVSVSLPVGLCRRQKGETREEGGHVLEGSSQTKQKQKAGSFESAFL